MQVAVACDHAGFVLKDAVINWLRDKGYQVIDCGTTNDKSAVDYPDQVSIVVEMMATDQVQNSVLICGSGLGMAIAANRHTNIRAAVCLTSEQTHLARAHNDANILCLGGRLINEATAIELLQVFFSTPFEGGRHQQRLEKIDYPL